MKILITNDDGWDAPGIRALREISAGFGDCVVVAPAAQQSGISHQLTMNRPLNLVRREGEVWSLDGTPGDCVRIALSQMKEFEFDLVISGINNGGNLGSDVYVSGTVAAARESAIFGVPAIAISQHRLRFKEQDYDWTFSKTAATRVLQHCLESLPPKGSYLNINLPDFCDHDEVPQFEIVDPCPLDRSPMPVTYRTVHSEEGASFEYAGKYRDRLREPGSDIDVCFSQGVSVTRIELP